MIRIILSAILILILPIQVWGETLTIDDLVERNDLYYKKFTNVPFTGEVSGKENGKFVNGKKDGEWLAYSDDGQLRSIGNYKEGQRDGFWEVNILGEINKGNYKNGKKVGLWEMYTATWQDGKKQGTTYLKSKKNYKDGEPYGFWEHYYQNGRLKSKGKVKNGEMVGLWEWFNEDGSLYKTETWKDDEKIE